MSTTATTTITANRPSAKLNAAGVHSEQTERTENISPETKVAGTENSFFDDVHFLGDKEGKVVIRSPPKFDNAEDQRTYQKQHLAAAFRVFARQGFDEGVAGHICKLRKCRE